MYPGEIGITSNEKTSTTFADKKTCFIVYCFSFAKQWQDSLLGSQVHLKFKKSFEFSIRYFMNFDLKVCQGSWPL
jgi:hypothetical protein